MDNRLSPRLESIIAHSDEVDQILGDHTYKVTLNARERLARHRHLDKHRITQTKGIVDHYVNLVGPAAVSVEVGHHNHWDGKWVEGLHILGGAIGDAG